MSKKITVKTAIKNMEKALAKLKALPKSLEVQGNFDQGGYTDEPISLSNFNIQVTHLSEADIDEDYEADEEGRPDPNVCITAVFY